MRSGSDQVSEFPASLTSMESIKSETGQSENVKIISEADESFRSPPSSQEAPMSRPACSRDHLRCDNTNGIKTLSQDGEGLFTRLSFLAVDHGDSEHSHHEVVHFLTLSSSTL